MATFGIVVVVVEGGDQEMEIKGGRCGEVESLHTLIFVSIQVLLLRSEDPAIKTDKSKRRQVGFGEKVLTDKKSAQFFLGPFLIQPTILFLFV